MEIALPEKYGFFFLFFFFCFIGNVLWTENKNKMEKYGEEDEFVM